MSPYSELSHRAGVHSYVCPPGVNAHISVCVCVCVNVYALNFFYLNVNTFLCKVKQEDTLRGWRNKVMMMVSSL